MTDEVRRPQPAAARRGGLASRPPLLRRSRPEMAAPPRDGRTAPRWPHRPEMAAPPRDGRALRRAPPQRRGGVAVALTAVTAAGLGGERRRRERGTRAAPAPHEAGGGGPEKGPRPPPPPLREGRRSCPGRTERRVAGRRCWGRRDGRVRAPPAPSGQMHIRWEERSASKQLTKITLLSCNVYNGMSD